MKALFEYLKNNSYPGRGIIAGWQDGKEVVAYFIMGRSDNSRNRIFIKKDDILFTRAFDESKIKDPSLIIYNAVRTFEDKIIVTNGDQTDTVYDYLNNGQTFEKALETREYEPDAPNYTPRISALLSKNKLQMAILKRENEECVRVFHDYSFTDNTAYFISTYDHDGNPLPSFSREPVEIKIEEPFESFAPDLWNSLDKDNRISLYVRFGNKETIFNKNEE